MLSNLPVLTSVGGAIIPTGSIAALAYVIFEIAKNLWLTDKVPDTTRGDYIKISCLYGLCLVMTTIYALATPLPWPNGAGAQFHQSLTYALAVLGVALSSATIAMGIYSTTNRKPKTTVLPVSPETNPAGTIG